MKIRRLAYRFMSDKFLGNRIEIITKKLNETKNSKERMKLLNENDDILVALMYKHRDDKEFIAYVHNSLEALLERYKD